MIREIWEIIKDEQSTIKYLLSHNVFYTPNRCIHCNGLLSLQANSFRCTKDGCRKRISLFSHSFFSASKVPPHEIMLLGYLWLTGASYTIASRQSSLSSQTIVDYFKHFRQLVGSALDSIDTCIGGDGIVVQVDESKFGKRKYNRGHHIEGAWVIGGVEETTERRFFAEVVQHRDSETIQEVLRRHLLPGTILHTDCWRGYSGISSALNIVHKTVNHSQNFVDVESGVHTNAIEGKWAGLKRRITLRGRVSHLLDGYLLEEVWRNKNKTCLWLAFIYALRDIYYE